MRGADIMTMDPAVCKHILKTEHMTCVGRRLEVMGHSVTESVALQTFFVVSGLLFSCLFACVFVCAAAEDRVSIRLFVCLFVCCAFGSIRCSWNKPCGTTDWVREDPARAHAHTPPHAPTRAHARTLRGCAGVHAV